LATRALTPVVASASARRNNFAQDDVIQEPRPPGIDQKRANQCRVIRGDSRLSLDQSVLQTDETTTAQSKFLRARGLLEPNLKLDELGRRTVLVTIRVCV
jgi:hypothetical protein